MCDEGWEMHRVYASKQKSIEVYQCALDILI